MSGREKPGLITDPTAFAYRPTHLHGGGTGLDDAWANWANDRRHIDSPSHGMATSPVPFESHSPVLPSTPDSMIFWGDPGLDPESDSDADSDSEGHPLAETTGIQGRLNTAAQPLLLASPPPTGSKKSEALDDATSERGPAARPGGSAGPAVQILILEDGEKAASERVPRPGPRSKQEPKLNNDRAAPRVRAAEKPEPDENLSREEQEEKAKKVQIANLAKRFPSLNLEEVKEALAATSFHAGRASKVLMRKVMDQRQAVDDMLEKEAEAVGALGAQTQPARPLAVNTSHGSSLAAADSQLPSAIQLTGSEAQPGINGIWVKSGKVNDRPAYLLTEESGLVMYWQYNIDVRCADGMQNQWLIADKVGSGYRAAARYEGLKYWCQDWQSDEMTLRKYEISARERFYKQEYCGCSYSLRDSNEWRRANGIPKIQIGGDTAGLGERYFTDPTVDAAEESQEVVDEFFAQANELAEVAGRDVKKRKEALAVYANRRKSEMTDGGVGDLNNW